MFHLFFLFPSRQKKRGLTEKIILPQWRRLKYTEIISWEGREGRAWTRNRIIITIKVPLV